MITKPRDWFGRDLGNLKFHGFARDGTRISRDLLKFHGTSVHGIGISNKKAWDGVGIANISTGSVWAGTGFSKFHGITGLFRIQWNPAGFSQREKIPRKALAIAGLPRP